MYQTLLMLLVVQPKVKHLIEILIIPKILSPTVVCTELMAGCLGWSLLSLNLNGPFLLIYFLDLVQTSELI